MIIGKTRTNQPVEGEEELKIFENIVDKDGHKRFIEGDITPEEITGINYIYAKWSLSGSHLMAVLVISGEVSATLTNGQLLGTLNNLPSWVLNKIYAVWGYYIALKTEPFRDSSWNQQNFSAGIKKESDKITITGNTPITINTAKKYVRIQFDLLIDNE